MLWQTGSICALGRTEKEIRWTAGLTERIAIVKYGHDKRMNE